MAKLFEVITPQDHASPEDQLREAMRAAGITPPATIVLDRRRHRFRSEGQRRGKQNGFYCGYLDGVPAGYFGCWKLGIFEKWSAVGTRQMSATEEAEYRVWIADQQAQREAERLAAQEVAASFCNQVWSTMVPADPAFPYLVKKRVKPHDCRMSVVGAEEGTPGPRLVVPMFNEDGDIVNLQWIDATGKDKKFTHAGEVDGCFHALGDFTVNDGGPVYLAEGYATAATVYEVTGRPTVVAFSAGNLFSVAEIMVRMAPGADICVVADNDRKGAGAKAAERVVNKFGLRSAMPPTVGEDANDFVLAGGDLVALLAPTSNHDGWLINADDFAAQPAPISWLIKGWLQSNALMMVHGPSGHGKTFVVLQWCLSMAAALPDWRGCKVREGSVVYLAGEGHHGLRGRIAAWKEAHGGVAGLRMWLSRSGCDLDKKEGLEKAVDAIASAKVRPSLIVVDTLHRFLSGDENSAADARDMLESCAELMSRFDCSVLLVHHTGVSEEAKGRARGSSAWRGALDIEISVSRSEAENDVIIIEPKKSKDTEMLPAVHGRLAPVVIPGWLDEDGAPVTSAVVVHADAPTTRSKADATLTKHRRTFEAAWEMAARERHDGLPYLSRSALEHYLTSPEGGSIKPSSAAQATKNSGTSGIIPYLLSKGFIAPARDGWTIIHADTVSALLIGSPQGADE